MGWNYRVMRYVEDDETNYGIHEVYYDSVGKITGWTKEGANIISDDRDGLLVVMAMMAEGMQQPVLDFDTGQVVEPEKVLTDAFVSQLRRTRQDIDGDLAPRRDEYTGPGIAKEPEGTR